MVKEEVFWLGLDELERFGVGVFFDRFIIGDNLVFLDELVKMWRGDVDLFILVVLDWDGLDWRGWWGFGWFGREDLDLIWNGDVGLCDRDILDFISVFGVNLFCWCSVDELLLESVVGWRRGDVKLLN